MAVEGTNRAAVAALAVAIVAVTTTTTMRKMVAETMTGSDGQTLKGRQRRKDKTTGQEVYNHQPQDDALMD